MLSPLLLALPCALPAQAPEDPGPFSAGWRDVRFTDQRFGQGEVDVRLHYPALAPGFEADADPAGGPYPLIAFLHGWLGQARNYDELCNHVASWGFVVVNVDTETGLFPDKQAFAADAQAGLWWVEDESATAGSWLEGMADPQAPWAASGHSMGGGTLSLLVDREARVRTVIGLQAADLAAGNAAMEAFDGQAYWIAGSADRIVPSSVVFDWFDRARSGSARNVFYEVQGMGHTGCTDTPPTGEPLSDAEQLRLHRRLVGGLLRAESLGEDDVRRDVLGGGLAGEPVRRQSENLVPTSWAVHDAQAGEILAGAAGRSGAPLGMAWSFTATSTTTPWGPLGIDPNAATVVFRGALGGGGVAELALPVAAAWTGRTLHFTALTAGLGREPRFGDVAAVAVP